MPVFLLWAGFTGIVLVLFVWGTPPFHFLSSRQLVLCVEELKLLFLLLAMPLLIKLPVEKGMPSNKLAFSFYASGLKQIIVFLLLLLPLSMFCASIAGVEYTNLGLVHLLYLMIGSLIVSLRWREELTQTNLMRFYYLIVFGLGVAMPLFYYLRLELFNYQASFILYFNPFWLVWRILYSSVFI